MKLKSLAAAALAVAAASQAHADIVVSVQGMSELFFVLGNDKGSFLLDTGVTVNALKSASFTSYVQNVTNLAGFSSYVASTTQPTLWGLAVYDGAGTANYNQLDLISTFSSTAATPVGINNNTFKNGTFGITGSVALSANNTGTHLTMANGSSYNAVGTAGYFGSSFWNLGQSSGVQVGNAVGTSSVLIERTGTTSTALSQTAVSTLTGYSASLDGATVTVQGPVAAVPEPSSYAMLAAGLAAVGFVVRRRRA